nr:class I SAM-dependent methyltransferase [Schlegelella koreensis]
MQHVRPRRIIEVGSGHSSAAMLDVDDRFLGSSTEFDFIDPYPERLLGLLRSEDRERCTVHAKPVQDVPLELFDKLEANDILFIDSSHVAKIGSDVVHLLTYVLPRLKRGVLVHVHDIFWPFEYPKMWLMQGRAWNENYMLKAFLQFNDRFRIVFFSSYLAIHHADAIRRHMPRFEKNPAGGIWLAMK